MKTKSPEIKRALIILYFFAISCWAISLIAVGAVVVDIFRIHGYLFSFFAVVIFYIGVRFLLVAADPILNALNDHEQKPKTSCSFEIVKHIRSIVLGRSSGVVAVDATEIGIGAVIVYTVTKAGGAKGLVDYNNAIDAIERVKPSAAELIYHHAVLVDGKEK